MMSSRCVDGVIECYTHDPHPTRVVQFLSRCQHEDGGFAGGPGQLSHLAPTYSAILSLAVLGTQEAYDCIDRWVGLCARRVGHDVIAHMIFVWCN